MYNSNNNSQEIDLIYLVNKFKEFIQSINFAIYRFIKFLLKNKFWVIGLIVGGAILGYILDRLAQPKFKTEIVVVPNFQSVDYLYNYIENLNSNKDKSSISSIKIEKVDNLLDLLEMKDIEVFKVLSDNGKALDKLIKDEYLDKNFKYHLITLETNSEKETKSIVSKILKDLNSESYFQKRGKHELVNLKHRKVQIEKSIEQINMILDRLGNGQTLESKSDFSITTYDQLNNVIELKNYYTSEIARIDTRIIEYSEVIFPVSESYNIPVKKMIFLKNVFLVPFVFFLFFLLIHAMLRFYHKYSLLDSQKMN